MEFFLIFLVFGISYAICASVGHYYIYSDDRDSTSSSTLSYDDLQKLKIYESAANHSREVVFAINQRLQVVTKIGSISEEDTDAFRAAYIDENPQNLNLLQNLFTAESTEQFVKKLPSRLFFLGRRWNLKNVYDTINSVLYIFLIDEEEFKYMISDVTDLVTIVDGTRTGVIDRIDEFLLRVRSDHHTRFSNLDQFRENAIRKLKMLVMHIAEMELADTSENLTKLIDELTAYKRNDPQGFLDLFSEEKLLKITKKDRERLLRSIEVTPDSYHQSVVQGKMFSRFDSYFETNAGLRSAAEPILLQIKKDCLQEIVDNYVDTLFEEGIVVDRKLKKIPIQYEVDNQQLRKVFSFIADLLPMIDSELSDESMDPAFRLRQGKSEYADIAIHIRGTKDALIVSFQSDSESLSEVDVREISQGKYFKSSSMITGEVVQDESRVVPNLHKCIKTMEVLGGKVEFKVNPGISTEFIFTVPIV